MTTARSEAACWLNEDCTRGYHGVMDEDGCQYGGKGSEAAVEVPRSDARPDSDQLRDDERERA